MALSDFVVFAQVISSGSLSAAGRSLGFTPAMVSKRINGLEKRLGVRLIQRTTRSLTLTDAGQVFHKRVTAIVDAIEEAETFVSTRAGAARGRLRISAPTSFGRMHLLPKLRAYTDNNPDVDLDIQLTDETIDLVANRVDVAIRICQPADSSLIMRRIAPANFYLCTTPSYLERHGCPENPGDLAHHQLLACFSDSNWNFAGPEMIESIPVRSIIKTKCNEVVLEALLAGMGIGLCASWDVADGLASGKLVNLLQGYPTLRDSSLHALYPSRRQLSASVRSFVDHLCEAHRQEPNSEVPHLTSVNT